MIGPVAMTSSGPQIDASAASTELPAVFLFFINMNLCLWEIITVQNPRDAQA
jgi:hypothetical protein